MSLAAVIVHFGSSHPTESLLDVLKSCTVVDRTVVVLHDSYPLSRKDQTEWIETENHGYAAGLNHAVKHLMKDGNESQMILALNPDIRVDSNAIEKLHAEHIASMADCTFPVLLENRRLINGYGFSRFGALKPVQVKFSPQSTQSTQRKKNSPQNSASSALSTVNSFPEWYSGACFIFTIHAWKEAGGFDESYFHYFEDRDFCLRVRKAGLRSHQASGVVIEHEGKSGVAYPESELPKYAVRNHLIALERSQLLGPLSFLNVITRHFLYLFRWKKGWRGIPKWRRGIAEFLSSESGRTLKL